MLSGLIKESEHHLYLILKPYFNNMKFIPLITLFIIISCNNIESDETYKVPDTVELDFDIDTISDTVIPSGIKFKDSNVNDISKVLAGVNIDSSSIYYNYTREGKWNSYAENLNTLWSKWNGSRSLKIKKWRDKEIPNHSNWNSGIYPFSGPDFLYFHTFFPNLDTYYMFGLESLGEVPDLQSMTSDSLNAYYMGMVDATEDLLKLTYFRTNWMKRELEKNGVIPIVLYFLARTDNFVVSVNKYNLNAEGELVQYKSIEAPSVAHIQFFDRNTKTTKNIYYLSADLINNGIKKHPELLNYFKRIPIGISYLKAASYLCHHEWMSEIRSIILKKSNAVLEEDTGIPYRFFPKDLWKIKLYGVYVNPVPLFTDKRYVQPELKKDFNDTNMVSLLPFRLGYHSLSGNDNLILAIRKTQEL